MTYLPGYRQALQLIDAGIAVVLLPTTDLLGERTVTAVPAELLPAGLELAFHPSSHLRAAWMAGLMVHARNRWQIPLPEEVT